MNKAYFQNHSNQKVPQFIQYIKNSESAFPILEEFSKFHKLDPEVTLLDLTDESAGIYFVRVKLNDDEIYESSGPSVAEARDRASRVALCNTRLKWPPLSLFQNSENILTAKSGSESDEHSDEKDLNSETDTPKSDSHPKLTREERLAKEAKFAADLKKEDEEDTTEESSELQEVRSLAAKIGEIIKWAFARVSAPHPGSPFPPNMPMPYPMHHGMNNSALLAGKMSFPNNFRSYSAAGSHNKRWSRGQHYRMSYPRDYGYANPYDFSFGYNSNQSSTDIDSSNSEDNFIRATLSVGKFVYVGIGKDRQTAKESATKKALSGLKKVISNLDKPTANTSTETGASNQNQEKKMPISIIYEMAAKKNVIVHFDLTETGRPQARHFVAKFSVADEESRSENSNKKQAKDNSAQEMLEKLKMKWPLEYQAVMVGSIFKKIHKKKKDGLIGTGAAESNGKIQSSAVSTHKPTEMDPISALTHCRQAAKKSQPEYNLVESGQKLRDSEGCTKSYPKRTEFIIECKMDEHVVQGRGTNKKTAKRNAAQAMVEKLNISLTPTPVANKSHKSSIPGGYPSNSKQPFVKKNPRGNNLQLLQSNVQPYNYAMSPHYMPQGVERSNYQSNRPDRNTHKIDHPMDNRRAVSGNSNRNSSNSCNSNNRQGQLPRGVIYAPEASSTQAQTSSADNSYNQMRHMTTSITNTSGNVAVSSTGFHSPSITSPGATTLTHNQHLIHSQAQHPDKLQQTIESSYGGVPVSGSFDSYSNVAFGNNSGVSGANQQQQQHNAFIQRQAQAAAVAALNVTAVNSYPNLYQQRDQTQLLSTDRVPATDTVQIFQQQQSSNAPTLHVKMVAMEMVTMGYSPSLAAVVDLGEHSLEVRRPKDLLSLLCQVFGFSCQLADFPRGQGNAVDYMTMVTVSTGSNQPVHTVSGVGATIESAYDQASDSMLRNFASNSIAPSNPSTTSISINSDPNRARMNIDDTSVHIGYTH